MGLLHVVSGWHEACLIASWGWVPNSGFVMLQAWERHLQQGTLRELAAPRLMKKAVLQQMEEAKAAGVDANFSQQTAKRSKSLAQLAENDDMVDL